MGRQKARKNKRLRNEMSSEQVIELFMGAVQEAVLVGSQIEQLDADTVMAVVDQLTPYRSGALAVYDGFIDREGLSRIAAEYSTGYARFVLLTALFFAHARGGFPCQTKAIHDIAGSPRSSGEPPQLSSDLDRLLESTTDPESAGLAAVFLPQIGAAFRVEQD
ncbi:hypothetical protein AB0E08_47205 [Streptomyces sp. NPDC048281]|uniref:hypothetical protein n=1 Tax=Streptomyces sp. NPDC048281 TaxID=3154715 RepID=UPI0034386308